MTDDTKPKGPASYFPINCKKVRAANRLLAGPAQSSRQHKHMEMVALLKTEHGMGPGPPMRWLRTIWRLKKAIDGLRSLPGIKAEALL